MINYLLRRVVYGILILLGVNLITFVLFFCRQYARRHGAAQFGRPPCDG